jgi:hypothetical protein
MLLALPLRVCMQPTSQIIMAEGEREWRRQTRPLSNPDQQLKASARALRRSADTLARPLICAPPSLPLLLFPLKLSPARFLRALCAACATAVSTLTHARRDFSTNSLAKLQ